MSTVCLTGCSVVSSPEPSSRSCPCCSPLPSPLPPAPACRMQVSFDLAPLCLSSLVTVCLARSHLQALSYLCCGPDALQLAVPSTLQLRLERMCSFDKSGSPWGWGSLLPYGWPPLSSGSAAAPLSPPCSHCKFLSPVFSSSACPRG